MSVLCLGLRIYAFVLLCNVKNNDCPAFDVSSVDFGLSWLSSIVTLAWLPIKLIKQKWFIGLCCGILFVNICMFITIFALGFSTFESCSFRFEFIGYKFVRCFDLLIVVLTIPLIIFPAFQWRDIFCCTKRIETPNKSELNEIDNVKVLSPHVYGRYEEV